MWGYGCHDGARVSPGLRFVRSPVGMKTRRGRKKPGRGSGMQKIRGNRGEVGFHFQKSKSAAQTPSEESRAQSIWGGGGGGLGARIQMALWWHHIGTGRSHMGKEVAILVQTVVCNLQAFFSTFHCPHVTKRALDIQKCEAS